jgi:hypothetical protein
MLYASGSQAEARRIRTHVTQNFTSWISRYSGDIRPTSPLVEPAIHRKSLEVSKQAIERDMATRLEERIGGRLQPDIVHQVFEEMREAPVKAASQMIAHRMKLVLEVLEDDRKRSVVWSCIQAWFEV